MMRRAFVLVAVAAVMLVALPMVPAGATPPSDVEFVVETEFLPDGTTGGPFTASGPAVDDGLMCETGDTIDVFAKASGFQSGRGFNIQVVKLFTCEDGSGDFLVKLQVRIDQKGDNFTWTILEGTGEYERLHGTGDGIGVELPGNPEGVLDLYSGAIHID
jgi:hypothetical protein